MSQVTAKLGHSHYWSPRQVTRSNKAQMYILSSHKNEESLLNTHTDDHYHYHFTRDRLSDLIGQKF